MRLPNRDGNRFSPNVDEAEALAMIRRAVEAGVNYVDTAYTYHQGNSERILGQALRDGYRDRVKLATKLPVWLVNEPADFDRLLDEQLERLQTDRIDCYLLHALDRKRWTGTVLAHGLLAKAEAAKRDGRLGYLGFSFHDNYETFAEIVSGHDWDFCQIQYNYMDTQSQAGTAGLQLAARRGLAVVVMEPLLGGRLADPPAAVRETMVQSGDGRSPAEWALQWLWDQPEVSVVLSGMSTREQVEQNLAAASRSRVGGFSAADQAVIEAARREYEARAAIPCTGCRYCVPCPHGVDIPLNFELYNRAHLFDDVAAAGLAYAMLLPPEQRADRCLACDECAGKCPQKIAISQWLPKVAATLSAAAPRSGPLAVAPKPEPD